MIIIIIIIIISAKGQDFLSSLKDLSHYYRVFLEMAKLGVEFLSIERKVFLS